MRAQIRSAAENEAKVALTRNKLVLDQARAVGLLGTAYTFVRACTIGVDRSREEASPRHFRHRTVGTGTGAAGTGG